MAGSGESYTGHVLVVDDETTICHVLRDLLADEGCAVVTATSAEEALASIANEQIDMALIDVVLPGMSGLELLERLRGDRPEIEVVIMTSHATVDRAVAAIRHGAYDLLQKPFEDLDTVWQTARRALEKSRLERLNKQLFAEQRARNDELTRAVARLTSLIDAGRTMAKFTSLESLLDHFIGLVCEQLDVNRASLMLLDEAEKCLRIAASRGLTDVHADAVRVALGEGVAGSVAQTGKPMIVADVSRDKRLTASRPNQSSGFISAPIVLSVPILARRDVLGVINATNRRSGVPFDGDDLAFIEGLTGQLAVAIERTRHLEDLQRTCASLESAQEQLVFSERMKTAGQLAAGVAHDFNNVLSVILGRAEFILTNLDSDPPDLAKVCKDTDAIRTMSLHGAEIIKRIQGYTRLKKDAPSSAVDLNSVVRDAVELTRPKWKEGLEAAGRHVEVKLEPGEIRPIAGHVYELTQVVGNLLFNAVDAMPEGGTVTFRTRQEGEHVTLTVSDTGTGMPEEVREKIFEPFFTTKAAGQGLGTSIIYGIVSRHDGSVEVASELGQGTTFSLRFPACEQATGAAVIDEITTGPIASARVLLVEDEPMVRDVLTEALTCAGHVVVPAEDGLAGAQAASSDEFDLVITDLSMPGMSGTQLAQVVKEKAPSTPVILLSGWVMQQEEQSVRYAGVDFVLVKPCLVPELLLAVKRALAQPVGV